MVCVICSKDNATDFSTDCVFECIERIKSHFLHLKQELCSKDAKIQELQQNNEYSPKLQNNATISPKKRRQPLCDSNIQEEALNIFGNGNILADLSSTDIADIGIILSSDNEFDNIATPKNSQEVITETETNPKSPRVLKQIRRNKHKKNISDENVKPASKAAASSEWISRETDLKPNVFKSNSTVKESGWKKSGPSLSFHNRKLKQTRLQLQNVKVETNPLNNTTMCEETIFPSQHASTTSKRVTIPQIRLLASAKAKKTANETVAKILPEKPTITAHENIPPMTIKEDLSFFDFEQEFNFTSVELINPSPQPVLQIDESTDNDITNIGTMDLLRNRIDDDARQIHALKILESKSIQEIQQNNSKNVRTDLSAAFEKQNRLTSLSLNHNIKLEKPFMETNENAIEEEFNNDYFDPIAKSAIKVERERSPTDNAYSEEKSYDVDCTHCQNFIKFLGKNCNNALVEDFIRKCTKHKKNDIPVQQTPEDFWNPFIRSFAEDDPRREVLIDTRFVGKTRRT